MEGNRDLSDMKVDISAQVDRIQEVINESRRKRIEKSTLDQSMDQFANLIQETENKPENVFQADKWLNY